MAVRAWGPASLAVVQAVERVEAAPWLIGCSGGPDSLALVWAASRVALRRQHRVRAIVVDHGLQVGSRAVADEVSGRIEAMGIDARVCTVEVDQASPSGLEAAARRARFAAFEQVRAADERVLLGHTLDDQAETVLLGLARGAGTRSLSGMAVARGPYRRPLLGLRRQVTVEACAEQGLVPWSDPQNDDPAFARVRVRTQVLPVLEAELGPGIAEALARSAELARTDADYLDALVGDAAGPPHCDHLLGLDPALRGRILRDWIRAEGGRDLSAAHLREVDRLITGWHGQRGVDVPGGRVVRVDGRLNWRTHSR